MPQLRHQIRLSIGILFVAMIAAGTGLLVLISQFARNELREQILSRDADMLAALAFIDEEKTPGPFDSTWFEFADRASQLRGVLGVSVMGTDGMQIDALPLTLRRMSLNGEQMRMLGEQGYYAFLHLELPQEVVFANTDSIDGSETMQVEEVIVPVLSSEERIIAYARFWIDGDSVMAEFAELDANLWRIGLMASGIVFVVVFGFSLWTARRLGRMGDSLEERTDELERANLELEMAARSAAVGAITAHLMHGLKNPLAGLRAYLKRDGDGQANEAANRMQAIVSETMSVLRAEERGPTGQIASTELKAILLQRWQGQEGEGRDWHLRFEQWDEVPIKRRQVNLIRLIVENLIQNAIAVAPPDTAILLRLEASGEHIAIIVADAGPGIAPAIRPHLFEPGRSTKSSGGGMGLAISRQLARAMNGELNLLKSDSNGTLFELRL
jgi:signal transduction histidine kinase